ncbi:OSKA protein, partial [Acromyrmex insinuator]
IKMEETVALIKSCIISKKGGVPITDLNDEFQILVGESIPYRRLGFTSLRAFLQTIDGLETSWNNFGEQTLRINDSKISHIDKLIRKQKMDYSKTRNKYYKQFMRNGNLRHDDRRQKNRLIYNVDRINRRNQNFAQRRDLNLFRTNGIYKNKDFLCMEEENHHPIVIETNQVKKHDSVYEPVANGQQLLGDDFFLQLAIRNLHLPIWRYKDSLALHCGLCISGQTISDCTRALRNINTISNRVVILLGSVDVYNNATCEEMVYDMTELLQVLRSKFHLSNTAITICTLPPLANLSIYAHKKQSMALLSFNNWIRSLTDDPSKRDPSFINYLVIDLYEKFCFDETYVTNYDWYQTQARRVSGTKHSYVLWNMKGRKRAMSLICEEENTDQSRSPSSLPLQ